MLSDISRRSNIVADRGPAKYFHGRSQILYDFKDLMRRAKDTVEGRTTMLIQGALGAGKTALLDVLSKRAKERGWSIAKIKPTALWTPSELRRSLGQKVRSKLPKKVQIGLQLGQAGVVAEWTQETTLRLIRIHSLVPFGVVGYDEIRVLGTEEFMPSHAKNRPHGRTHKKYFKIYWFLFA